MAILSPIMSYIVDKEVGFPIPSEKEKINKALRRYRQILSQHSNRSDAPEIMFGIADLLVGRGEPGDWAEAQRYFDRILLGVVPDYLRARALVGKAELLIGQREETDDAISLCEKARQIFKGDLSDFFTAKTFLVEAELLMSRHQGADWHKALKLLDRVVKEKKANWYFKGRAFLVMAEIKLYQQPGDLGTPLKHCDSALYELRNRPDDYFYLKGLVLKAEINTRRAKKGDFERAAKLLNEVVKSGSAYKDLIARAKLDLADVVSQPKAIKLVDEVNLMEGLDPYLIEKSRLVAKALRERKSVLAKTTPSKKKK
jgi:tetratricopeptide (TPR) repeat protein